MPKRHFSWPSFWDHQRTCCDKKFRSKASRNVKFLGNRTPQEGSQSINGDLPINLESTKLVEFVLMIQKCESHVSKNKQHVIGPTKLEHSDTKSYTNLQWHDWHGHRHLCFSGSLSIAIGFSSRSRHWQSEHVAGHLLNTLGKSDQIWDGQCVQDLLSLGRISKNCRPSSNELCSGAFQSSNFVLSLHTLFMWCCPRSKPIHHATGDPRNQKSCCLSAVSHRAHLLRGYFAAPESAGKFFTPKPLNVGVVQQLWQRIWDPNMFTQEVCNHSLPVGKFFKGWR